MTNEQRARLVEIKDGKDVHDKNDVVACILAAALFVFWDKPQHGKARWRITVRGRLALREVA